MAWLETDRHGRLRIGFKYYDGLKCREPLGVSANKQTIAEARRLCAKIQLELKARTFDYAKRFPDSDRIKQRGIETPEKIQPISVTVLADSWLLSKQGEVKKSTHGYYKEVAGVFIQRDAIGTKTVSELRQEDIDRWRVRIDEKQTKANEPLSTRRKNMAWDVLNQILEFARVRKLLNEDLLLGGPAALSLRLMPKSPDDAAKAENPVRTAIKWAGGRSLCAERMSAFLARWCGPDEKVAEGTLTKWVKAEDRKPGYFKNVDYKYVMALADVSGYPPEQLTGIPPFVAGGILKSAKRGNQ